MVAEISRKDLQIAETEIAEKVLLERIKWRGLENIPCEETAYHITFHKEEVGRAQKYYALGRKIYIQDPIYEPPSSSPSRPRSRSPPS